MTGKVERERRARRPWITEETISKMDERGSGRMSTRRKERRRVGITTENWRTNRKESQKSANLRRRLVA